MTVAVVVQVLLALCGVGITLVIVFAENSARAEVTLADSEYASWLFRSNTATVASNGYPIRFWRLFSGNPPKKVAGTIHVLRWLHGIRLTIFALFVGNIVVISWLAP